MIEIILLWELQDLARQTIRYNSWGQQKTWSWGMMDLVACIQLGWNDRPYVKQPPIQDLF